MGFFEWLGISPRDAPALSEVTDNVRDSGQTFVFGRADSGEKVDEKSAMQIATVYACVRLLAETVAGLPLHLYRMKDGSNAKERAVDHPLYKLLYRQPNPEMTSFSFRETMMTHLLLWGNSYAQIIRDGKNNVLALYPLLPEYVETDRDEKGQIYYIYHAYTDEVPGAKNKDVYFRYDEVFHVPGLGFNGLVGFSPIAMMKNSLGTTLAVEKYGSAFFKNGAQPSGVLEHPGVLKNPEKIRENWSDVYGGANNAHKVAVLEEGMQYKAISLPPEDSQFLSTRQFGVNEICRIFRVPPHMVQDLEHATFSNIEHQSIDFVVHTLSCYNNGKVEFAICDQNDEPIDQQTLESLHLSNFLVSHRGVILDTTMHRTPVEYTFPWTSVQLETGTFQITLECIYTDENHDLFAGCALWVFTNMPRPIPPQRRVSEPAEEIQN